MSQNYTVKDVKKGSIDKDAYGQYQNYGLAIQGIGEPVRLRRSIDKPAPEVGDVIYGFMAEFESKGRIYNTLVQQAKPEVPPLTRDETIKSQWAINQAVQIWIAQGCLLEAYDNIQAEASHFYEMINNIRGDN